ncbi:MAG: ribonuclease III [Bacteroidales bacterium]|nr:ribonuclease III [Bacteroidales bacterium]
MPLFRFIFGKRKRSAPLNDEERRLSQHLTDVFGIVPNNIGLYQQALVHRSALAANSHLQHNERLEFLGDSVIDLVVAHHLYICFPNRDEGQLTKLRSSIVSRTSLNTMAVSLGIDGLLRTYNLGSQSHLNIYGNALEAMVGAIYLDHGFEAARKVIVEVLLERHIDIENIETQATDSKSMLIELCQKKRLPFEFVTTPKTQQRNSLFVSVLHINHRMVAEGSGASKKEAEQQAAQRGLERLRQRCYV